jgi:hypothetical protein
LNVHEGRAAAADLLATCSTNDVGADALMEVGISELLRTHLVSTHLGGEAGTPPWFPGTLRT